MQTLEVAQNINVGAGRVVLHFNWEPIESRVIEALQRTLRSIDSDSHVLTVFPDGLRCLDEQNRPTYWRNPLATLAEVVDVCIKHGVRAGTGFWLPTGFNCKCPFLDIEDDQLCILGDCTSCLPSDPPECDWFGWREKFIPTDRAN